MRKFNIFILTGLFFFLALSGNAQKTVTLEDLQLSPESYWNGSDSTGEFQSDSVIFGNVFNEYGYGSWSSFAYSNITDTSGGYANQYAANTGKGYNNSDNYGVFYYSAYSAFNKPIDFVNNVDPDGIYITNSAWADSFILTGDGTDSLKFGGVSGNRKDSMILTIKAYDQADNFTGDSLNFYLADYTFTNSQNNYLVQDWTYVDLSYFSDIRYLRFEITASQDMTPTYVCFDKLSYSYTTGKNNLTADNISVYPNPFVNNVTLRNAKNSKVNIYSSSGKKIKTVSVNSDKESINLNNLSSGIYFAEIIKNDQKILKKLIK